MGASKAADYVIIQDVGVCDICGARGFEEFLTVCTQCNERAEHVYCMQTLCDAVPLNWVCEGCRKRIILESGDVQSERDSCAHSMTGDFKENQNIKRMFSQRKASAEISETHQKHNNNRQGSEEFETETTIEAEHSSDCVSKKLSCLILSAEDGLSACTSDESASESQTDCSSPAATYHQSDLERVCHSLKVDGVKMASNPQLNDSSAVDAPENFTKPSVALGAIEHPLPTDSSSLNSTCSSPLSGFCSPFSRSTENVLPFKACNSLLDSIEVIDMEIDVIGDKDVDSGNVNVNAREPRTQKSLGFPSLALPNQPALSWTLLEPPSLTDFGFPQLPPDLPPVQPSPPATPLESGTQEDSPLSPLSPDSPPTQPSPKTPSDIVKCTHSPVPPRLFGSPPAQPSPKTSSDIVKCTHSPVPPLLLGSPPAQPCPPSTSCDQFNLDNNSPGSPSAPPSHPTTPLQSHQDDAHESNLDSSAVSKHKLPGDEGDCSMSTNLESLASLLDKKRARLASRAENIVTCIKAPRYGFQSDIFEILLDVADPSRSKRQAPSKQQDLEHKSHREYNISADGHTPLCPRASSDQQVKDHKKNASSVGQLCKDSLNSQEKLLDKASQIRTESGLKSNEEPHFLSSRSCSDLPCPSIVEQAIPKEGKEDNRLVPWVSLEDGQVTQPSSMSADASLSSILNGVCAQQDITADIIRRCMDEDLISKVGGDCNVDDVRTCENARDNMCVQQVSCLSLFPAAESSSAFDRTGILVDLFSEHEFLSDLSWQVMPLVQQLEKPWYKPLPNLNNPPFPSSLDQSLIDLPDEDFALTLRLPQYRKHGNIWITIESDTRTCYDENVKKSLSCCTL